MNEGLFWRRDVLSSGMRVLLFHWIVSITMQLAGVIEYESNADSEDASGIAYFLENMLAGSLSKRIELSNEIERLGGSSDF